MPKLIILLAAILLVTASARTSAQEANPEPGYCAQFYPNADCNSLSGATNAGGRAAKPTAAPKRQPRTQPTATAPKK